MKPYLTHELEIKFAKAEMETLRQMGILRRGSSEFLSPIMLIKKVVQWCQISKITRIQTGGRLQIPKFSFT